MNYFLNVPFTTGNLLRFLSEFKCQRCQDSCCLKAVDGVAIFPDEIDRLAGLKGLSKKQFKERFTFTREDRRFMPVPCPFFNKGIVGCTIHRKRPRLCQQFPFNQVYRKNGKRWMTVNVDCPGGKIVGEKYGIKLESVGVKV